MMFPSPGLLVLCCVLLVLLWWLFRPVDPDAPKLFFVTLLVGLFGVMAIVLLGYASAALPLKFDAYLYLIDNAVLGSPAFPAAHLLTRRSYMVLRPIYEGIYFAGVGFTKESGEKLLEEDGADAIVFRPPSPPRCSRWLPAR